MVNLATLRFFEIKLWLVENGIIIKEVWWGNWYWRLGMNELGIQSRFIINIVEKILWMYVIVLNNRFLFFFLDFWFRNKWILSVIGRRRLLLNRIRRLTRNLSIWDWLCRRRNLQVLVKAWLRRRLRFAIDWSSHYFHFVFYRLNFVIKPNNFNL